MPPTSPCRTTTIQAGLDAAMPGDTVSVRDTPGPWFEKIVFPRSGPAGSPITLRAFPGDSPVLDGTGVTGANMVLVESRSYVRFQGFEVRNNLGVNDGSGVRIVGAGTSIEIRDNRIHEMRGQHAMGIAVYGTEPTSISGLVFDGNEVYDCDPARSEAVALNGKRSRVRRWPAARRWASSPEPAPATSRTSPGSRARSRATADRTMRRDSQKASDRDGAYLVPALLGTGPSARQILGEASCSGGRRVISGVPKARTTVMMSQRPRNCAAWRI